MASNEDVLIAFNATDSVSSVAQGINSSVTNMGSGIRGTVSQLSQAFGGLDNVITGAFAGMTGKSVYDIIIGTSSKAETNDILLSNMASTEEGAMHLKDTVDKVTNESLMSMQDMIPALNGIKAATGATEEEITSITEGVANFGSYVYALTGSQAQASTSMFDLSKGIKGLYASLDQYGITEDSLMKTGLWSGKESDVKGYIDAVNAVTGSTEELMDTNSGLDARLGKMFSAAGKEMGKDVLPVVKDLKTAFIDLNASTGGDLAKGLLYLGGAFSVFQTAVTTVGQIANSFQSMIMVFDMVKGSIMGSAAASLEDAGAKTTEAGATAASTTSAEAKATVTQLLAQSQWEASLASAGITEGELSQAIAMGGSTTAMEIKETATVGLSTENMGLIASELGVSEAELGSAVAHAGTTTAVVTETAANAGLTASLWAMTTAFLTNPVFLIVAGFIALAVAVYEVGKGFGWWTDLQTMLESISAGVKRLWAAFMNNPNVQATLKGIQDAFGSLMSFLSPVVGYLQEAWASMFPDDGSEVDVVRMIIDAFGILGDYGGQVINYFVDYFQSLWSIGVTVASVLVDGWNSLVGTFQTIYGAIQGVVSAFNNAMNTVSNTFSPVTNALGELFEALGRLGAAIRGAFGGFGNEVSSEANSIFTQIQGAFDGLISFLSPVGVVIGGLFSVIGSAASTMWNIVSQVFTAISQIVTPILGLLGYAIYSGIVANLTMVGEVASAVASILISVFGEGLNFVIDTISMLIAQLSGIINIITMVISGQMSLGEAFKNIGNIIVETFMNIGENVNRMIGNIFNTVISSVTQAGRNIVNRFIFELNNLRMRASMVFSQVINVVISFASSVLNRAIQAGRNIVNGVVNTIVGMPGRIKHTFTQSVQVITSYVGQAYTSATSFGRNIVNGAISFVSQLPGKIREEFAKIPGQILSQAGAIGSAVNELFGNLVDTALSALGIASPGFVQRAVAAEFAQIPGRINESTGSVILASRSFANGIVAGFDTGSNDLDLSNNRLRNKSYIDTFNQMGNGFSHNVRRTGDTTIIIQEGAVQLDSRNLTTKECNQIMITALESLDDIEEIKVKERDDNNA